MPKKSPDAPPDLRTYINPKPGEKARFTADWQREMMPTGPNVTEYLETPKLKTFVGGNRVWSGTVVKLSWRPPRGPRSW